jgi:septum formation protein
MGIDFTVEPSPFEEYFDDSSPHEQTQNLARGKVRALLDTRPELRGSMILGADTCIDVDGRILGKPADRKEAERQLRTLSGRRHDVITALALYEGALVEDAPEGKGAAWQNGPTRGSAGGEPGGTIRTAVEITHITVASLSEREISWYLDAGEWEDAAGGYRIQGRGAFFVERIEGCYFNVMGLPLRLFYGMLTSAGWELYRDIPYR